MKGLSFDPRAVLVGALFAVLAGCGGRPAPGGTSGFVNARTPAPPRKNHFQSFGYPGTRQTFTAPPGVTSVTGYRRPREWRRHQFLFDGALVV